jgi:hypothetical protein
VRFLRWGFLQKKILASLEKGLSKKALSKIFEFFFLGFSDYRFVVFREEFFYGIFFPKSGQANYRTHMRKCLQAKDL